MIINEEIYLDFDCSGKLEILDGECAVKGFKVELFGIDVTKKLDPNVLDRILDLYICEMMGDEPDVIDDYDKGA
jgi:hypothetical protein